MARRRRHSKKTQKSHDWLGKASFTAAFLSQISDKDRQNSSFSSLSPIDKVKVLTNSVTGRVTGVTPFPDVFNAATPRTFNPSGVFNSVTYAGLGGVLLAKIGRGYIPHSAKITKVSKNVLLGGIIGGVFDDPAPSAPVSQYSNATVQGTNAQAGRTLA